jgi:hypothetical protein
MPAVEVERALECRGVGAESSGVDCGEIRLKRRARARLAFAHLLSPAILLTPQNTLSVAMQPPSLCRPVSVHLALF